jgi:predicted nucleic-acid-binding protein
MTGLDTNVLVRYLTQDEPAQARLATRKIKELNADRNPGFINTIVLCETIWVLSRGYGYPREAMANTIEHILLAEEFEIEQRSLAWAALQDFRNGQADFADCLIARTNSAAGCKKTISFDRRAAGLPGFEIL